MTVEVTLWTDQLELLGAIVVPAQAHGGRLYPGSPIRIFVPQGGILWFARARILELEASCSLPVPQGDRVPVGGSVTLEFGGGPMITFSEVRSA